MKLRSFDPIGGSLSAFVLPDAQQCEQRWADPNDLLSLAGAVGSLPALGDDIPPQELIVQATFRFAWGQTVNSTPIDSWADLVAVLDAFFMRLRRGMGVLQAEREDGTILWAYAKALNPRRPSVPEQRRLIEVPLTFHLYEATWYGISRAAGWCLDAGFDLDDGLYLDAMATFDLINNDTFEIDHEGNAVARVMQIGILAIADTVTNPRITNNTTGEWVQWTGSLTTTSDPIYIDPAEWSIVQGSTDEYDNLSIGSTQFAWMTLEPGLANQLTFTCSGGGTARVTFDLYPHYLEA
jgi:hypothetical protein